MSKSRQGASRRVVVGLLAGALGVFGLALAPPAGARSDATADRLAGVTRYGTAAAIAGQSDFDGATTAILASGENFPDALAASGLAGANSPAPIVLTQNDTLTDETRVALSELGSLDDVIVVGGTAAVSDEVVTAVEDEGYTVTRLAGNDRYETAAAIAGDVAAGEIDSLTTALIASGEVFADALAGGPIAAAAGLPILLVNADGVPAATEAALDEAGIEQVVILGGTARITDETETELEGLVGNDAVRVAGVDRFETATLIASTLGEGELGWAPETVLLASGLNFPDALAAGPLGGIRQAPIVLSASIPAVTLAYLDGISDTLRNLIAIGGTAAVSDEDLQTALTEGAQNVDNDASTGGDTQTSVLQGPELQSAAISGIDIDELAITYTFTFDADLDEDATNPELFKLYNANSNVWSDGATFAGGDEMDIDGETATVVFNLADYGVANATLAAVEEGAVEDENGNVNPPQSVGTSGISNGSSASLLSAEIVDEDDGIVEFEFASPVIPGTEPASYYQVITKEGYAFRAQELDASEGLWNGDADTYPDDDEPSTTVRVKFLCTGDNTPAQYSDDATDDNDDLEDDPCSGKEMDEGADFSDENIRRAVVGDALLGSARVQVVDVASGGTTDAPDLSSVTFASADDDLDDNQVLFTFDESIDTVYADADPESFLLIYSFCAPGDPVTINGLIAAFGAANAADETYDEQDGQGFDDEIELSGGCALTPDSFEVADESDFNDRSVVVTFPDDLDLENDFLLAAQVAAGAVSDDDDEDLDNQADEVEFGPQQPASLWDDGEVAGPQLVDASVEVDTGFGGDFDAWILTLTFDKDIEDIGAVTGVQFWFDDGENVESEDLTCEVEDDATVTCEITDEDSDFANATVVSIDWDAVVTDDTFVLGDGEEETAFSNPEASIEVEVPEAPESDED